MTIEITTEIAAKVLETVDAGLVSGVGNPIPGQMCVEAAVCYAMGLQHGDEPDCVSPVLRALKIRLNDSEWSSNDARAKGMRRLAVAQLGSADGALDEADFLARVVKMTIGKILPRALRSAAQLASSQNAAILEAAALECEANPTSESAANAQNTAYAARQASGAAYRAVSEVNDAAHYARFHNPNDVARAADYASMASGDRDGELAFFAEEVVNILIDMDAPGCQWLVLAPLA